MTVLRIVPNLQTDDPGGLSSFYAGIFGLDVAMNLGFIMTMEPGGERQAPQLSLGSEGGGGTPLPALSIEVDDLDAVVARCGQDGVEITHGPVEEPWGVRRFFLRDPAGHLVNVLEHRS